MGKSTVIPFWRRAKKQIKAHKITQKDFSAYVGVNFGTFKNWIYYGLIPDARSAYIIATALGVTVEYLVTGLDGKAMRSREKDALKRKTAAAKIRKMALQIEKNAGLIG